MITFLAMWLETTFTEPGSPALTTVSSDPKLWLLEFRSKLHWPQDVNRTSLSVDTMRRIDRWAGVPLCALATALLRIWWWLRPMPPRPVRRVLFIELSEMGSTILADPAMRKARARLDAELYFVIFAQNAGSLDLTGTISRANVFCIRITSLWHFA